MSDTKRRPDFIVRAKDGESEFWHTLGAAWSFTNGKPGYAVRLNLVPTNFDGSFILIPPLEEQEEAPVEVKGKTRK
jgi:hypothetical protein